MIFNVTGGGAVELNYKVVASTAQPSSAPENTIWVNTAVTMTGYVFSDTAPASPAQGLVWIVTGSEATRSFNALKKGGSLYAYPWCVEVYDNGLWVGAPAKIYQSGAWHTLALCILDSTRSIVYSGDSSWAGDAFLYDDGSNPRAPKSTYTDGEIMIATDGGYNTQSSAGTMPNDKIDMTEYAAMKIFFSRFGTTGTGGSSAAIFPYGGSIATTRGSKFAATEITSASGSLIGYDTSSRSVTVDISAVSGEYYPAVFIKQPSVSSMFSFFGYVSQWWLE